MAKRSLRKRDPSLSYKVKDALANVFSGSEHEDEEEDLIDSDSGSDIKLASSVESELEDDDEDLVADMSDAASDSLAASVVESEQSVVESDAVSVNEELQEAVTKKPEMPADLVKEAY